MTPSLPSGVPFAGACLAVLALAGIALAAPDACAQWRTRDGSALPAASDRASRDGFGVMLGLADADEAQAFREEWYSTATGHAPAMEATSTARRGDTVSLAVLYAGCAAPTVAADVLARGQPPCTAMLTVRVTDPNGVINTDVPPMSLAQGQPSAPPHIVQLSPVELKIRFEPTDPLGEYRIEARVELPERGIVLTPSTTVTLLGDTPAAPAAPAPSAPAPSAPAPAAGGSAAGVEADTPAGHD